MNYQLFYKETTEKQRGGNYKEITQANVLEMMEDTHIYQINK